MVQVSVKDIIIAIFYFDHIRQKIKVRLGIEHYCWQTSIIFNALNSIDIVVKAGKGSGKYLTY